MATCDTLNPTEHTVEFVATECWKRGTRAASPSLPPIPSVRSSKVEHRWDAYRGWMLSVIGEWGCGCRCVVLVVGSGGLPALCYRLRCWGRCWMFAVVDEARAVRIRGAVDWPALGSTWDASWEVRLFGYVVTCSMERRIRIDLWN